MPHHAIKYEDVRSMYEEHGIFFFAPDPKIVENKLTELIDTLTTGFTQLEEGLERLGEMARPAADPVSAQRSNTSLIKTTEETW